MKNTDEREHEADEARMILDHPVFIEAFASVENDAIERMLDDDLDELEREMARHFVNAIRKVKEHLEAKVLARPRS